MTEVEKFVAWVEDQVENHGLLQISGTHLDKNGTAMDVLKSKRYECRLNASIAGEPDPEVTLEDIARGFNSANAAIERGDYTEYVDDVERTEYPELFEEADKNLDKNMIDAKRPGFFGDSRKL